MADPRWLFVVGILLWIAALPLASLGAAGGPTFTGLRILLQGWQGLSAGVVAWLANPLLLVAIGCGLARRYRIALILALAALLVGMTSVATGEIARLSGRNLPELSLLAGFYCWMAAQIAVVIGGIAGVRRLHSTLK